MAPKAPAPSSLLPDVPQAIEDGAVTSYLRRLREAISGELLKRPRKTEPVPEILMISPDQTVYRIVISNGGVLSTEVMPS